jgi:tetratricopeptide (TPR) repeat protein
MMNLQTPMMKLADKLANDIELEMGEGRRDKLTFIGPGFWGLIYRSKKGPSFYRLIPIKQVPLEKRDKVRKWIYKPRMPGIAPIVEARQPLNFNDLFFIRYEIKAEKTWIDVIANTDISIRLQYASRILSNISIWWEFLEIDPQSPLFIMPSDIVFINKDPYLLSLPDLGSPGIEAIFSIPQRGLYFPPEYICGQLEKIWGRNVDIYSIGVALFQCLFAVTELENAERLLVKIATGTLFSTHYYKSRLPYWLDKVDDCQNMISMIKKMIHPDPRIRSAVDPMKLAKDLDDFQKRLAPEYIVNKMIDKGKSEEAFLLMQDILLDLPTYDLLLLAGKIAWKNLGRPLEAIDLLERAIDRDRGNPEAFETQFNVIMSSKKQIIKAVNDELDRRAWRNFHSLPVKKQLKYEGEMPRYLMWRKQYTKAADFIYPRLFEEGIYKWWKFEMTLAYLETFIRMEKFNDAQKMIQDIKNKLIQVRDNRTLPAEEIHKFGTILSELETMLYNLKKDQLKINVNMEDK